MEMTAGGKELYANNGLWFNDKYYEKSSSSDRYAKLQSEEKREAARGIAYTGCDGNGHKEFRIQPSGTSRKS
jgi:hypothetical protein